MPSLGPSVSPVCRAGTGATGASTAGPVKSWLGAGEGLWGALGGCACVWWDCPRLCKFPKSATGPPVGLIMGSRFKKAPVCCVVLCCAGGGFPWPQNSSRLSHPTHRAVSLLSTAPGQNELFPPVLRVLKVPVPCRYRDMDVTHGSCATLCAQPSGGGTGIWRPKSCRNVGQAGAETPPAPSPTALQGQKVVPRILPQLPLAEVA